MFRTQINKFNRVVHNSKGLTTGLKGSNSRSRLMCLSMDFNSGYKGIKYICRSLIYYPGYHFPLCRKPFTHPEFV